MNLAPTTPATRVRISQPTSPQRESCDSEFHINATHVLCKANAACTLLSHASIDDSNTLVRLHGKAEIGLTAHHVSDSWLPRFFPSTTSYQLLGSTITLFGCYHVNVSCSSPISRLSTCQNCSYVVMHLFRYLQAVSRSQSYHLLCISHP